MQEQRQNHEPSTAFAARLEAQIVAEIRRRRETRQVWWAAWQPLQLAGALAVIVLVSMGLGGAAVAAAYEAEQNQARNEITALVQANLEHARTRLGLLQKEEEREKTRLAVGMSDAAAVIDKGISVAEAEAEVARLTLDLEEIAISGREPRREISAPRVSGRDFVGDRLRIDLRVPQRSLDAARQVVAYAKRAADIGTMSATDLAGAQGRVMEIEGGLALIQRKVDIRERFLAGKLEAAEAELRVIEATAEQRIMTLAPKLDLAQRKIKDLVSRVEVGVAAEIDVNIARAELAQLQAELSAAQLDLAVVRKRLADLKR